MYKIFVLTVLLLVFLPAQIHLVAQPMPQGPTDGPPPMANRTSPEQELERLDQSLKLSEEQKAQILPLLKERADAIEKLVEDQDTSMRDKLPKILAIIDQSNEQIRGFLTDSQKKKFDSMVVDEKKQREMGPDDGPTGGPPPGDAPLPL